MTPNGTMVLSYRLRVQARTDKIHARNKKTATSSEASRLFVFGKRLGEFDGSASFFESLLRVRSSILTDAGQDLATSSFGQGLGLAETEAGQLADDLDNVDLLGA